MLMRAFSALIALLLPELLIAQGSGDGGRIEGILSSRATSQPLRKGSLALRPAGAASSAPGGSATQKTYTVISDAEGKFVLDQVEPGRYRLTAEHAGYLPATYRVRGSAIIAVNAGERVAGVRFEMMPYGVVSGRVVDEGGDPITEVWIVALRYATSNGRRLFRSAGTPTAVDDQGGFRIANILPGRYILAAHVDTMTKRGTPTADYVTTYYSNAVDPSEAAMLSVGAGSEVNATIRLRKERVFHVEGKIVDAASGASPSNSFALELRPQSVNPEFGSSHSASVLVTNGTFSFDKVLPGSYTIEPSGMVAILNGTERFEPKLFGRYQVTVTTENLTGLLVPFSTGVTVGGVFAEETESQSPLGSKPDSRTNTLPTVRLIAERAAGRDFFGQSKNDGTFEFRNVAPERYLVGVSGLNEGAYIKSMRFAGQEIPNGILNLTAGASGTLEIAISSKAADVSGVVRNDKSENVADVLVTLAPVSARVSTALLPFRQVRTDQDGQFKIKSLPPGEYRIVAWEEVDVNVTMDPEFRQQFDNDAMTVKLQEGSHQDLQLKVVLRGAIELGEAKIR